MGIRLGTNNPGSCEKSGDGSVQNKLNALWENFKDSRTRTVRSIDFITFLFLSIDCFKRMQRMRLASF